MEIRGLIDSLQRSKSLIDILKTLVLVLHYSSLLRRLGFWGTPLLDSYRVPL